MRVLGGSACVRHQPSMPADCLSAAKVAIGYRSAISHRRVPLARRQWEARQNLPTATHASGLKDKVSSNFWPRPAGCWQAFRSPCRRGTSHWRYASGTRGWARSRIPALIPGPSPAGRRGADLHAARADDGGWAIAVGMFCSSFDKSDSFHANNILLPSLMGRGAGGEG